MTHNDDANRPARPKRCRAFEWDLDLPSHPVSRRLSRAFGLRGPTPVTLGELKGPGCIRRIWMTGSNLGRSVVLRIYCDGQPVPYVEAPLGDFFGVLHDLEFYRINTPFLAVKPKNGYTCSFPMPFATSARIEAVGSDEDSHLYYMIDWHEYPAQELKELMRFCARWRREAPCRDYADDFLMLDADGPGQLVGFGCGIDMLESRHTMRWSHAGADSIYIDGDGEQPAFLRGIGGEDTFGTSYSGGDYAPQTSLFSDMPCYEQKDPQGDRQRVVGYRFFVNDAIHFRRSLHMRFGCRAHDLSAVVYWYSAGPVRPYFTMPPPQKRRPGSELRRGECDLPLPESGQWWVAGPFPSTLDQPVPTGAAFDPGEPFRGRPWVKFKALRGFVELNHVFRPPPSNANSPTLEAAAVARCTLDAPADVQARLRIAWDDRLVLRVNDREPIDLGTQPYLQARTIDLPLRKGRNAVAIRLTNTVGLTRGAWNFAFRCTTPDGRVLLPQAEGHKKRARQPERP